MVSLSYSPLAVLLVKVHVKSVPHEPVFSYFQTAYKVKSCCNRGVTSPGWYSTLPFELVDQPRKGWSVKVKAQSGMVKDVPPSCVTSAISPSVDPLPLKVTVQLFFCHLA